METGLPHGFAGYRTLFFKGFLIIISVLPFHQGWEFIYFIYTLPESWDLLDVKSWKYVYYFLNPHFDFLRQYTDLKDPQFANNILGK